MLKNALVFCLAVSANCTPADEVRSSGRCRNVATRNAISATRYLTMYSIAAADRSNALKTISYVLNALSRTRAISQPILVSPTLVRFNIGEIRTTAKKMNMPNGWGPGKN